MVSSQVLMLINIGIILFVISCIWSGFRQGFLLKALGILGFFVVGFLAWWLSTPFSNWLALYPKDSVPMEGTIIASFFYENLNRFFIFIILFILFNIVIMCIRPIFKVIGKIPVISLANKIAGSVLGGVQAILILLVITMLLRLPFWAQGTYMAQHSYLRHGDVISEWILYYAKEPLKQIEILNNIADQDKKLSKEDVEDIRTWLLEQNVDKESVESFIGTLRYE